MSITFFFVILTPILFGLLICKLCFSQKLKNRREQYGTIQERMKKKFFFGYGELIQTMTNEDLQILQQTYENTVKNAQQIKICIEQFAENQKKKIKKVNFRDEIEQNSSEQSKLI